MLRLWLGVAKCNECVMIATGGIFMASAVRIKDALFEDAKIRASAESRSTAEQITYWATLGKACEDNPELPFSIVKDILISKAEAEAGLLEKFSFDD
jgi:hypothetical protein